jgi:solute:Na+ symporter, SSS family
VADGEPGELVFTTLTKEAFPLIRYRTRDIADAHREAPAPAGAPRAHEPRHGRTDDMLIIRGVNVFPSQIEEALLRVEGTAPHYLIEVDRPGALDEVTVLGILWLTFLNIFVGIFVAFVFFGARTRRMGLHLDAHTFPEWLGRRFQSRFLQGAVGLLIFVFMPLYAASVLIGAAKFISEQLHMDYEAALFTFSVIIALYVIMGGLKGVMYTDALQGTIMFVGMAILLVMAYWGLGGVVPAHQALTDLAGQVPEKLAKGGHLGWTSMPQFGSPIWWTLVSTIVMGVGIGVLAQPQLAVRYMTVKSDKELNRAVPIGGVFILMMTGVAFVVGALSNVYFFRSTPPPPPPPAVVAAAETQPAVEAPAPVPAPVVAPAAPAKPMIAIVAAKGDVDRIMPMYLKQEMPDWFGVVFMLTLMAAAMSTLSSQFHTMGTSLGRDVCEQALRRTSRSGGVMATRVGILLGIVVSVWLGYVLEMKFKQTGTEIIARGTAIFFGLCASAFLPMYIGGLWSRRITRSGAIAGMLVGTFVSLFWMLFVHEKSSTTLLLCKELFGTRSLGIGLLEGGKETFHKLGPFVWAFVDPLIVALPLSALTTFVVSCFTSPLPAEHVERCFKKARALRA